MRSSKIFSIAVLAVFVLFLFTENLFASPAVNWTKQTITVTGMGFAPVGVYNPSQAVQLAKRAAINDAYRQLAEVVNGVKVTGETTVNNMILVSDIIKTNVEATIKGAQQISERETADGGFEITMQMPLFGVSNSLAGAVLERPEKKEPFPEPVQGVLPTIPSYTSTTPIQQRIDITIKAPPQTRVFINRSSNYSAVKFIPMAVGDVYSPPQVQLPNPVLPQVQSPKNQEQPTQQVQIPSSQKAVEPADEKLTEELSNDANDAVGGYTGVIVDCRDMDLQPVMSPVIKNEDDTTIYGHKNLDYDKVISLGMVSYITDLDDEGVERAGKNPLIVRAVDLKYFSSVPVISNADANRILIENKADDFLAKLNVVFMM